MSSIVVRPDLRTAGGEVNDIVCEGRFVGSMTLVYREGDRICGSVQLDKDQLSNGKKDRVIRHVQEYVQSMVDAVEAVDCDVLVTYGRYHHVIATSRELEAENPIWTDNEDLDEGYEEPGDELTMGDMEDEQRMQRYELVIVGESRNRIEYHVYGESKEWIAEAFLRLEGADVFGEISFMVEPAEDEIEAVADLLVSDFNDNEVDTFQFRITFEGETLETIELTHEDLLEDEQEFSLGALSEEEDVFAGGEEEYSVILVRDDGDTLTYEIYEQTHGGLPVGTATVDIATRSVTGFVDFRDRAVTEDRDTIAALLMQEVDKERDYDTFNLTVMCNNRPMDELLYEMDTIH